MDSRRIMRIFVGIMTPLYIFIALVIQGTFITCDEEITSSEAMAAAEGTPIMIPENNSREELVEPNFEHTHIPHDDPHSIKMDFLNTFFGADKNFQPGSSAAMMAHITNSDLSPEEQLENMKEMANEMSAVIKNEMANLLSFALANCDKGDNHMRKRRSIETPMDSTQMVMRLLKHIKSNNEYQNIAIEKMMTAQQIADKFGIEFNPDPEILSDMAVASNKQADELTEILKDSVDYANQTETVSFVPVKDESVTDQAYYVYAIPEIEIQPILDLTPQLAPIPHHHHHHHHQQPETQMMPPPVHQHMPPVTQRSVYGPPMPQQSMDYFPHYKNFEPVTTTTTIVLPVEEPVELESELVGEEYEETITSKISVDHEEPGAATVNHVMTYTVSEKAHFRTPQIETLPQQMQYYFFL